MPAEDPSSAALRVVDCGEGRFNEGLSRPREDRNPNMAVVHERAANEPAAMGLAGLPEADLERLGLTERRLQTLPGALPHGRLQEVDQPPADHSLEWKSQHSSRGCVRLHHATSAVEDHDGLRYEVDHRSPEQLAAGLAYGST